MGKSTVLSHVCDRYTGDADGIIAKEMRDAEGARVGFAAVNIVGERRIFAHKTAIHSDICVGGKYFVDVEAIDTFVVPEILKGWDDPNHLTFLDEIGRMQAFSPRFLEAVRGLLEAPTNILATIVRDPEPWSLAFKQYPEVILVDVTIENRERLSGVLNLIFSRIDLLSALDASMKRAFTRAVKEYFVHEQYIQLEKLFKKALPYILDGHAHTGAMRGEYFVEGDTRTHRVQQGQEGWTCDCDLFRGDGLYKGNPGECSHIQTIRLMRGRIQ